MMLIKPLLNFLVSGSLPKDNDGDNAMAAIAPQVK
jgi:hypothetical protein